MTTPQNYFLDRSLPSAHNTEKNAGDDYLRFGSSDYKGPHNALFSDDICKIKKLKHCIECGRLTSYVFNFNKKWSWRICAFCMTDKERTIIRRKYEM